MGKKNKTYFIFLAILFVGYVILQHYQPKPINWQLDFGKRHKYPFACYVLNDMLPSLFPDEKISENITSFYQIFKNYGETDNNLIIITNRFNPDHLDLSSMLDFVGRGNHVFISTNFFSKNLEDTLHFRCSEYFSIPYLNKDQKSNLYLLSNNSDTLKYNFHKNLAQNYFTDYDTIEYKALGTTQNGYTNFMATPYGHGMIFLHCQPLAFTNYHILYGNSDYTCHALSYLPVAKTIWDEYYKPNSNHEQSPVRYVLKEPALKYAYLFTLIMILIYMVFESKRKQRKIKIITPLQNESLKFVETVGQLYFKSKNHTDLAKKKIIYFKEFLRNRYQIFQIPKNENEIKMMAEKSGVDIKIVKSISGKINYIEYQQSIHKETLVDLHKAIEEFKRKCI